MYVYIYMQFTITITQLQPQLVLKTEFHSPVVAVKRPVKSIHSKLLDWKYTIIGVDCRLSIKPVKQTGALYLFNSKFENDKYGWIFPMKIVKVLKTFMAPIEIYGLIKYL